MSYSFLISVYEKEHASYLEFSIQSMLNQTLKPDEIILVCDGKLTTELNEVVEKFSKENECIKVIRIQENGGLGNALNEGLKHCTNEFILRMDSDDYSIPTRAEIEVKELENNDIVGSNIVEFEGDIKNIIGARNVPLTQKKIRKFAKKRSPFNHPSVAFRKSFVEECGGYQHLLFVEDYYLWVRMIQKGARCENVKEPLVYMRSGKEMRKRRGGRAFNQSLKKLRKYMLKTKFINIFQYSIYTLEGWIISHMPIRLKEKIYRSFLRTTPKEKRR